MSTNPRIDISKQHPSSYRALVALSTAAEQSAAESGLAPLLVELVKLRTSQINGCAFCLRMHTRDALAHGESIDRIAVLLAWRETSYFTEQEQAAIALVESVTLVAVTHVDDAAYAEAQRALTPDQISAVAWLTTVMNAFNRVSITSRFPVAAG